MAVRLWNNLVSYLHSSWQEAKRVTWPTKYQALYYTAIVVFITFLVMVYLGAIDAFFSWAYFQLNSYFQVY